MDQVGAAMTIRFPLPAVGGATAVATPTPYGASPFSGKTAFLAWRANRYIRYTTPALGRCHGLARTLML